jgi:hypothetical protein
MPTLRSNFDRKGQPLTADAESMPDGGLLVPDGDSFRSMVWPCGGSSQPSDPAGSASGRRYYRGQSHCAMAFG